MKERPILFSAPMVREILEDRKTVTRRVIKPNPQKYEMPDGWGLSWKTKCGGGSEWMIKYCPYGFPGDRLWVKETWHCDDYSAAQDIMNIRIGVYYRSSEEHPEIFPKWKPSIFMPRWASRITLEITDVKVERLQEISEEDAIKEGAKLENWNLNYLYGIAIPTEESTHVKGFANLWDSINKKNPWSSNPWVWVISFRRLK